MASRIFTQSASMVVDIMLATPERRAAISRIASTYHRLAQLIIQSDRETLIQEFKLAQSFLGEEINSAAEESTYVINTLSVLLAAKEVGQKQSSFVIQKAGGRAQEVVPMKQVKFQKP
ncbi:MAG: hypothetical protein RM368_23675 [Nostoc sp. DedSLP03]|uniref:hypothetical protein n=1 Tax=Nostoc sp. DedSLP03 TaxID=3075400 RepID=UPI002AD23E43|nr:hypothetical protein [Nostoc sp. DedSLP03]MDZ7967919.1 hypothetical protein [Nostoc sp. DedSLP03]